MPDGFAVWARAAPWPDGRKKPNPPGLTLPGGRRWRNTGSPSARLDTTVEPVGTPTTMCVGTPVGARLTAVCDATVGTPNALELEMPDGAMVRTPTTVEPVG